MKIDLTAEVGKTYGRLTVLGLTDETRNGSRLCQAQCDCGKVIAVRLTSLRSGNTSSCGCFRRQLLAKAKKQEVGHRYGRLVVISEGESTPTKQARWICQCDCGKVTRAITGQSLREGRVTQCAECSRSERVTHGMTHHPAYASYQGAKARCENPNHVSYHRYGGRGIKFLFKSFEEFWGHLEGSYQPGLSIERINNDGHYEVGNVTWATGYEQNRNMSSNVWYEWKGERKIMADWAKHFDLPPQTIAYHFRVKSPDEALAYFEKIKNV